MGAWIVGSASTVFRKWEDRGFRSLSEEVVRGALADAGASGADVEQVWFGNCAMGVWGQSNIRGQVALTELQRSGELNPRAAIVNVEAGCATGSAALHGAVRDVLAGADLALAVGVEKTWVAHDPPKTFELFQGGVDQLHPEEWRAFLAEQGAFEPHPARVMFLDVHAMQARAHMARFGTTAEQIAHVASKDHHHGSLNDKAQYRFEVDVASVLADRPVIDPFTRAMCCPVSDGAAAALVCSDAMLERLPPEARARAVRVRSCVLVGGTWRSIDERNVVWHAVEAAYRRARIAAADVDLVEVHDATSFCEIQAVEALGLRAEGEGGAYSQSGATALGGATPVNVSGGLVSKGHPLAATGLGMIDELVLQLRGEAGPRQVAGAGVGVQHNAGGLIGLDEAVCAVSVLSRD